MALKLKPVLKVPRRTRAPSTPTSNENVATSLGSGYYGLILQYQANLIAPLMVLNPLMTVGLGIAITRDPFDLRMGVGTALALFGVLLVTINGEPLARLRTRIRVGTWA